MQCNLDVCWIGGLVCLWCFPVQVWACCANLRQGKTSNGDTNPRSPGLLHSTWEWGTTHTHTYSGAKELVQTHNNCITFASGCGPHQSEKEQGWQATGLSELYLLIFDWFFVTCNNQGIESGRRKKYRFSKNRYPICDTRCCLPSYYVLRGSSVMQVLTPEM